MADPEGTGGPQLVAPTLDITAEGARALIRHVVSHASVAKAAVTTAVVDNAGVLVALDRMDGAPRFSAEVAATKARTAATFGRSTAELEALFRDRPVFASGFLGQGNWYVGRGGYPIVVDGAVVGGIGVSGDSAEHEDDLAREAVQSVASPATGTQRT